MMKSRRTNPHITGPGILFRLKKNRRQVQLRAISPGLLYVIVSKIVVSDRGPSKTSINNLLYTVSWSKPCNLQIVLFFLLPGIEWLGMVVPTARHCHLGSCQSEDFSGTACNLHKACRSLNQLSVGWVVGWRKHAKELVFKIDGF